MAEKKKPVKKELTCPYCSGEMAADSPFCEPCKIKLFWCPECGMPMPRTSKKCPNCGAEIKVKA
ncbi:MAG: hypothetical protein JW967_08030 [Dehalococcoidales bacterium]|nr:hypothetical protein [Dehalococcoidales bacterium]